MAEHEIAKRCACRLAADVLDMIEQHVRPGVSTDELDRICHDYIVNEQQAVPAPLNYRGFPKSICTSVNHVVCHGIPGDKKLKDGDIKSACQQACPTQAIAFGDLNDPGSGVRQLLAERMAIRRKPGLGTQPEVYYIIDDPRTLQETAPAAVVEVTEGGDHA